MNDPYVLAGICLSKGATMIFVIDLEEGIIGPVWEFGFLKEMIFESFYMVKEPVPGV
jgi:hypothetical protein